jgi:hypothetical protein
MQNTATCLQCSETACLFAENISLETSHWPSLEMYCILAACDWSQLEMSNWKCRWNTSVFSNMPTNSTIDMWLEAVRVCSLVNMESVPDILETVSVSTTRSWYDDCCVYTTECALGCPVIASVTQSMVFCGSVDSWGYSGRSQSSWSMLLLPRGVFWWLSLILPCSWLTNINSSEGVLYPGWSYWGTAWEIPTLI